VQSEFNPYREWLGREEERPPANHYELLGVRCFESDREVLFRAAEGLLTRVRSIRPGPYAVQWQQVLDRLNRARVCLLNPEMKAVYDAALRGQAAGRPAAGRPAARPNVPFGGGPTAGQDLPPSFPGVQPTAGTAVPAGNVQFVPNSPPQFPAPEPQSGPPQFPAPEPQSGLPQFPVPEPQVAAAAPVVAGQPAQGMPDFAALALDEPARRPAPGRRGKGGRSGKPRVFAMAMAAGVLTILVLLIGVISQSRRGDTDTADQSSDGSAPGGSAKTGSRGADGRGTARSRRSQRKSGSRSPESAVLPRDDAERPPDAAGAALAGNPAASGMPEADRKNAAEQADKAGGPRTAAAAKPGRDGGAHSPDDAAKRAQWKRALAESLVAMGERQYKAARDKLIAASDTAQTDAELARVQRLEVLLGNLEQFHKLMGQFVAALQVGDEIPTGGTVIIVAEKDDKQLTLRREARNQSYPIADLPREVVVPLAEARFAKDVATKVLLGSYLAVDSDGDPALARQLWQEASQAGVDTKDLITDLVDLGLPLAGKPPAPTDADKLDRARQSLHDKFQAQLDEAAGSAAKKAELAQQLLEQARVTLDDRELRYVMLQEAIRLATASGKPALACRAVDQICRCHSVEEVDLKMSVLERAMKTTRGAPGLKEIAEQLLKLIEQAAEAGRTDDARRLLPLAEKAASRARNAELVRRVKAAAQQLDPRNKGR
jgi:hypothetical protein